MTAPRIAALVVLAAATVWGLAACGSGSGSQSLPGGQASRGKGLIEFYGCGACHVIGGIDAATGEVGPRLTDYQDTRYIAGHLANTPENTARWIEDPQRYEPGTIMPDLGVTPAQAADIASYLEGQ
jgi:cytochrome c2